MRKILSVLLVAIMVISTFATLCVSADEAGAPGNWETHLDAFEEAKEDTPVYQPLPGYEYTDDGFEVLTPEYNNVQAKYTVISKTKYSTKDFSIKIRVDEFDPSGDAWLSFTFWSECNGLAQGGNQDGSYGYGWTSLVRDREGTVGTPDGKLSWFEGYSQGTKSLPGGFTTLTTKEFEPVVDENGYQILEFKVENHLIYINGVKLDQDNAVSLRNAFRDDEYLAYFGISAKSGLANTPVKFTILEVDGVKPTGSDRQDPEVKTREFGPMIPASTIPAGQPGVLFDASCEKQNTSLPSTTKCSSELTENETIKITAADFLGAAGFSVKNDYTVDIKDFPYVAIVLKNYCTCTQEEGYTMSENCVGDEAAGFFYCAGKVLAPDNDHRITLTQDCMVEISPDGSADHYTIFYAKIDTTEFEGAEARIHSLRFDFAYTKPTQEFEIVYAGYFAKAEDIATYAAAQGYDITPEDIVFDGEGSDDPIDEPVDPEDNTTEDDTEETTTKKKENKTTEAPSTEAPRSCGSVIGMGAVAVVAVAAVAGVVTFKKREED